MIKKIICLSLSAVLSTVPFTVCTYAEEYENEDEICFTSGLYGDITGDKVVNINDLFAFNRYLVENDYSEYIDCVDLNGDGTVNLSDLMILKQYIAGKITYPVCTPVYRYEDIADGIRGIDVSKWQEDIDWYRVKQAGIEFAMIKAGEGTEEEVKFRSNIENALNAGIKCGVYWFSNACDENEAIAEAQACLDTIAGYPLEYPVAYDFEYRSIENNPAKGDRWLMTEIVRTFLYYIQSNGYYPVVYSNLDFLKNHFYPERFSEFDLWYARYNVNAPDWECFVWQKSCKGHIDGIDTDVDLDIAYKDYSQIIKRYHWNGL